MAVPFNPNSPPKLAQQFNDDPESHLMRPKPQMDVRGMGAQEKREKYLRAPTRASLDSPNNDAGQQSSQAEQKPRDDLPGRPVCGRCIDEKIKDAVAPKLSPELQAMRGEMDPGAWQSVLQHRAFQLVNMEVRQIEDDLAGLSYQRGYQARQQEERSWSDLPDRVTSTAQAAAPGYRLVCETDTQRFYKAEAQPHPAPASLASEVDCALAAVSRENKALDDVITTLEGRLGRLMRPEQTGKAPNACPVMASLPMEIMAGAACMQDSVDRLNSILDRLVL